MDIERAFGLRPFTVAQARQDLDLSVRAWRRLAPHLVRLHRGVYCVRRSPDDRGRYAQRIAAELLCRTDHHAYSLSAACLLDLPNPTHESWDRLPVHLGGPQTRSKKGVTASPAAPVLTPWGPCTDLTDTAATIAAELPLPQALMVTDAVARRLAGTEDRFVLASEACRTEVRRRLTRDCDLPALRMANPAAESPAESFYRGHMLLDGHVDPPCGVPRRGASGAQFFIDILLGGLAIEIDGLIKYTDRAVLRAEKTREDDLRATGLAFHRVWADDLFADPAAEMSRLTSARGRLALPA